MKEYSPFDKIDLKEDSSVTIKKKLGEFGQGILILVEMMMINIFKGRHLEINKLIINQ